MNIKDLPTLNALLNTLSAVLLIWGRNRIKNNHPGQHRVIMITALATSLLFLTSYLVYHYHVGSIPYPKHDWTRVLYFIILVPHVVLAGAMTPFILLAVGFALASKFTYHKRLVRWVWPVWIFVSVTGVIVYLMLYRL